MLNLCLLPTALRQQPRQTPVFLLPLIFLSYNGCIQQAWSFFIFFFVYFFPLLFLAIPSGVYIPWWREDITFVLFFFYMYVLEHGTRLLFCVLLGRIVCRIGSRANQ